MTFYSFTKICCFVSILCSTDLQHILTIPISLPIQKQESAFLQSWSIVRTYPCHDPYLRIITTRVHPLVCCAPTSYAGLAWYTLSIQPHSRS